MHTHDKENLYKKTEGTLHNYPSIRVEIENLRLDIEDLRDRLNHDEIAVKGKCYSKVKESTSTNAFNSAVENEVISYEEDIPKRIDALNRKIRSKERILARVNNAMEILTDREKKLIELKYFKHYTVETTAELLEISVSTVTRINRDIVLKIMNSLYPSII